MATITTFAYDAVGGVPSYTSGNIADWLYQLTFRANGVIPGSDGGLAVSSDGIGNVLVQNGACSLAGRSAVLTAGPASTAMTPLPSSGFRTAYAVVMRYNTSTQTTSIVTIAGSTIANPGPAVNPAYVELTDILLAYVLAVNTAGTTVYTVTDARVFSTNALETPTGSTTYSATDLGKDAVIIAPLSANATIDITAGSIYQGNRLFVKNTTSGGFTLTLHYSASLGDISLSPGAWIALAWDGSVWVNTTVNSDWDLVIDSNAKLDLWCQHVGGLYKRVLIRAGTWTASALSPTAGVLVNLDNTGTKYVFAEKGSNIVYSASYAGTMYGLYRATLNTDMSLERFEGISINITNSNASNSTNGFYNLTNMTDCNGVISSTIGGSSFINCNNLINCIATAGTSGNAGLKGFNTCNYLTGCTSTMSSASATGSIYAYFGCNQLSNCQGLIGSSITGGNNLFANCSYLSNCNAKASLSITGSSIVGYTTCEYITGCLATITNSGLGQNPAGFAVCNYISSSQAIVVGPSNASAICFQTCKDINSCNANASGASSATNYGFLNCSGIVACIASSTNAGAGLGYGYGTSNKMQQNRVGTFKSSIYNNCFADAGTAQACSDTAAGGYNS